MCLSFPSFFCVFSEESSVCKVKAAIIIKLDEHIMNDKALCERLKFGLEVRQKDKAMLL